MKKLIIILALLLLGLDLFTFVELDMLKGIAYLFSPNILDFQIKETYFLLGWILTTLILNVAAFKFKNSKVLVLLVLEIFGWIALILYGFTHW